MKEERLRDPLRTSDIAEALNLKSDYISKIASKEGIRGEKEGIGRGKQTRYTIEQAEALARAYRGEKGVKQLYDWINNPRENISTEEKREGRKKEGEKKQAEKEKETTVQRALSDSYASSLKRMTEETDWWIDAITRIGHSTVLIAFQEAKVPPEALYEEVKKFKSAEEFISKVEEYMVALFEAKNDAKSLLELKKRNKSLYYKLLYVIEIGKEFVKRFKKLESLYNLAVSNLDEEGLRKFAVVSPMILGNTLQEEEEGSTTPP